MNKSICFAYYADGKWIGWYGGTFGGVSKSPKVYSDLEKMRPVIQKNLTTKLQKINETTFEKAKEGVTGLAALGLLVFDSEELLRGKDVELRVVECPEYDGPNPNFDAAAYDAAMDEDRKRFESSEVSKMPIGIERLNAVKKYREEHPAPKCDNWIYADYAKVKEWAKNEPTEFIEIIKPL